MNEADRSERIGLALSGGGIRAAVFHLGVLRHLAECGRMEDVAQISTVSGGSLIVGAVFAHSDMRWPSSQEFLARTLPELRQVLTSSDLMSFRALGLLGALKENVAILTGRAAVLSRLLESRWNVVGRLADLPATPEWHINATCFETGKNWRFTRSMMGDWQFGRHFSPDISIASAIASSAAVPYAIGALKLDLPEHGWWMTDPATKTPVRQITRPLPSVRLWDGGAYENMGLEPLYKPDSGLQGCDFLICSDASGPLTAPKPFSIAAMAKGRLASPRLFDVASDQIRALRSRMLMGSIARGDIQGILVRMGTSPRRFGLAAAEIELCVSDEQCLECLAYPTNLTRINEKDFGLITRHAAEVARLTWKTYAQPPPRDRAASS